MTDKELADKVVALGMILRELDHDVYKCEQYGWADETAAAVRAWDVAGALMERCDFLQIDRAPDEHGAEGWMVCAATHMRRQQRGEDDSLPRAIIAACVEALS